MLTLRNNENATPVPETDGAIWHARRERAGALFARAATPIATLWAREPGQVRNAHVFAFFGLCLFTVLLYVRPNDFLPADLGNLTYALWSPLNLLPTDPKGLPIVKTVAIFTLATYVVSKLAKAERLTVWPLEMKALALIVFLGVLFMPIAAAPKDTYDTLTDTFLKVAIISLLMVNLIDTRARLRTIMRIVVVCGSAIAIAAIYAFWTGKFTAQAAGVGVRIEGAVGGIFANPNDLATALNLLLPIAVALGVRARSGFARLFYFGAGLLLIVGVIATFSRGGFLGLLAVIAVLLFKLGRKKPAATTVAVVLLAGVFLVALSGTYGDRLSTIMHTSADGTGSAQERIELLKRAVSVAVHHTVLGVGMGNYHIYSIREMHAHNSYLEISAELGVAGLLAYLILIFAPLFSLRRVEKEAGARLAAAGRSPSPHLSETVTLSIALQAAFVGYAVCSFFTSIQYLWYLYYLVAYAVSLRTIYHAEYGASTAKKAEDDEGVLWNQPYGPRALPASEAARS
jgi:O-antigen ligase